MPTVHLLHGFVGAGKTTFAKKLAAEVKAIRFTPDEWVIALYGTNPPADKFREYENNIIALIWKLTEQNVNNGFDVILDFGFWKKHERDAAKAKVIAMGAKPKLYKLYCPDEVYKSRVLKRTAEMQEGALFIDANAIEEFKARFEAIDPDAEECIAIDTSTK